MKPAPLIRRKRSNPGRTTPFAAWLAVMLLTAACTPRPDRLWDGDHSAMLNRAVAQVLSEKLLRDHPGGGVVLVVKDPLSQLGGDEPSEARFDALQKQLAGRAFTFKKGGLDAPHRKNLEPQGSFAALQMESYWQDLAAWTAREGQPVAVVLLQGISPSPPPGLLATLPRIYGTVPQPDPDYNAMVASGEAGLLLVQSVDAAALQRIEKDFGNHPARVQVGAFYQILE